MPQKNDLKKKLKHLDQVLEEQKNMLIVVHNNPDPDALASAVALRHLAEKRYNVKTSIAYGGLIGRAENRALVKEIKIPLKNINRVRFASYDRIAVVDTQPGAGNNSLPKDVDYHIVIDHHPSRKHPKSVFTVIEPKLGATATILMELLVKSEIALTPNIATALAYAIRSETQDLGREAHERDINAFFKVYSQASVKKFARISTPKLPRSYFKMLARTLNHASSFRHLIIANLGEVEMPEIVAEMADMLLRHERMSWALCTGRYQGELILSLRSSNPGARSAKVIKHLVPERANAGGHDMFAGGKISLENLSEEEISELEDNVSHQFAKYLGFDNADWKPVLEDGA